MFQVAPQGGGLPANERLKESFNSWLWASVALSAGLHFALLAYWPEMSTADIAARSGDAMEQIDLVEVLEAPPPMVIARPAVPVVAAAVSFPEEVTVAEVTFEKNPVIDLPAPRIRDVVVAPMAAPRGPVITPVKSLTEEPDFTPYEIEPQLKNRTEFARLLERAYPPLLKRAGVGGTVVLWVYIDEMGNVLKTRVVQTSGQEDLDAVAQRVIRDARFSPALNHDRKVPVWIQLPVAFSVD